MAEMKMWGLFFGRRRKPIMCGETQADCWKHLRTIAMAKYGAHYWARLIEVAKADGWSVRRVLVTEIEP